MDNSLTNSDRIEIYLDAVSGFITDIDPEDRAALRGELRAHLIELVAQYRPGCVFEEDAVEAALRKFGPAYRVGPALNRMTPAGRERARQRRVDFKIRWTPFLVQAFSTVAWSVSSMWSNSHGTVIVLWLKHHLPAEVWYGGAALFSIYIGMSEAREFLKRPLQYYWNLSLRLILNFAILASIWYLAPGLRPLLVSCVLFWVAGILAVLVPRLTEASRSKRLVD